MSTQNASNGGTSILGLLGVAFIVLKLCGVIHWSWWWVTAPFWGGLVLFLVILFGVLLVAAGGVGIAAILDSKPKILPPRR